MLAFQPARSANLQVSPVMVNLPAKQAAEVVWLSNSGSTTLQAQARIYAWTQENGEDVLQPTNDMVASPPMLAIKPGERQVVRLIRVGNGKAPPAIERTYRVVMDELPLAASGKGVQFVLRYSVPIFVSPKDQLAESETAQRLAPPIQWTVQRKDGGIVLVAANQGDTHAKVTEVIFSAKGGKKITLSDGLYGYVLARSTRHWPLTEHARQFSAGGTLQALVNEQPISIPIGPVP
ncbi:MAG TPA: molecular chaperone [Burkholderiaceae bacterium]|nr:molecular chaperone [Burkholderiaceae bacterium]